LIRNRTHIGQEQRLRATGAKPPSSHKSEHGDWREQIRPWSVGIKVEHAARGPKARPKARDLARPVHGTARSNWARAGLKHIAGRARADPSARWAARHGPLLAAGTVSARYQGICEI